MEALVAEKNSLLKALKSHSCVKASHIPSENNSIFEAIDGKEGVVDVQTSSEKRSATLARTLNLEECSEGNKSSVDQNSVHKNMETKHEEHCLGKEVSVIEPKADSPVTTEDESNNDDNVKPYVNDRKHEEISNRYCEDSDESFEYSDETESPILKMLTSTCDSEEMTDISNNLKIKDLVDIT
jgi:hypothetical protein